MIRVRFNDPDNLVSCESFMQHAFPGTVATDGNALELTLRAGNLGPMTQHKVVERLLWAWRISHRIEPEDGFVPFPPADAQTH